MSTWLQTTLNAGPLASNSYIITIPGLSASTIYEYRAIFIVSGVSYYGNTLTGTTAALPMTVPLVNTGTLGTITATSIDISNSYIINKGSNLPIQEYGILYTQNPTYSSNSALIYGNLPINVIKQSTLSDINTGTTFTCSASLLASNTLTYYRSFAKTGVGIGYGNIYNAITCSVPLTGSRVYAYEVSESSGTTFAYGCSQVSVANIGGMPVGDCYNASFGWQLFKPDTLPLTKRVCFQLKCNSVVIGSCNINSKFAANCSGTISTICVASGDIVELYTCAESVAGSMCVTKATIGITDVTPIVGTYSKGTEPEFNMAQRSVLNDNV